MAESGNPHRTLGPISWPADTGKQKLRVEILPGRKAMEGLDGILNKQRRVGRPVGQLDRLGIGKGAPDLPFEAFESERPLNRHLVVRPGERDGGKRADDRPVTAKDFCVIGPRSEDRAHRMKIDGRGKAGETLFENYQEEDCPRRDDLRDSE